MLPVLKSTAGLRLKLGQLRTAVTVPAGPFGSFIIPTRDASVGSSVGNTLHTESKELEILTSYRVI